MPAITLVVTNAGRAALVDAATAGTFAVRIAEAGLSASAFTPLATATTLPGEFARVAGVSGNAIDPDTITLVIRDDSAAVYTLRGLGLFLDDGTLFAIYSQATPILEKAANSTALIVLDVRFADIAATSLTFGDANFLNPPATTSVQGVIEIATDAEAIAGTDAVRAITPASLKALVDNRFGAAAASAFVRTLLTAASAAAFRLTLGLKSAALKDEGIGNGLDADLLDGQHLRVGANSLTWPGVPFVQPDGVMEIGLRIDFHAINNDPADYTVALGIAGASLTRSGNQIWDAGNDGAGSGLDADLLDGQDGGFYTNIVARLGYTPYNAASVPAGFGANMDAVTLSLADPDGARVGSSYFSIHPNNGNSGNPSYLVTLAGGNVLGRGFQLSSGFGTGDMMMRSLPASWTRVWTAGNDGAGSGLDADLLDGQDGSFYANIIARLGYTPANNTALAGIANPSDARVNLGLAPGNTARIALGFGTAAFNNYGDFEPALGFTPANVSHTHVEADIAPAFYDQSLTANGYQTLPGGLLLQWGQVRGAYSGEGAGPTVNFPIPFSAAPFSITTTPINTSNSNNRDTVVQTIARDTGTFSTYYQNNGGGGANIDGFDWFAIGPA